MQSIQLNTATWASLTESLHFFSFNLSHQAATLAVNLLLQTTLVVGFGLVAVWMIRRRGAALQSSVLRMTLVATLCCPVASWLLHATGISGFRIELALQEPRPDVSDAANVAPAPQSIPLPSITSEIADPLTEMTPISDSEQIQQTSEAPWAHVDQTDIESSRLPSESMTSAVPNETRPNAMRTAAPESPEKLSSETKTEASRLPMLYLVICGVWCVASGLMLTRLVVANLMMEGLRRQSRLAPEDVVCDCREIARQMSVTAPPVLINQRLSSPCLLGWLRPAVMIPANLHPIRSDVLAHELAHLRRRDCFWSLLGHLTVALLPWQPLVWWITRRMEQAADDVCDDYVVAHRFDRVSYARELVTIAERFPAEWTSTTAAVGIAEFQSCLGNRVQRILDCSRTLSLRTGWKNLLLVIAASFLGTIIVGFLGAARNELDSSTFSPNDNDVANVAVTTEQDDVKPRDDLGDFELDKESFRPVTANAVPAKEGRDEKRESEPQKNLPDPPLNAAPNSKSDQVNNVVVEKPKNAVTADAKTPDEIQVTGVVLKPDGTPAAGATIRSGVPKSVTLETRLGRQFTSKIHESIADANGRFSISMKENPYQDVGGLEETWKHQKNSTVVAASLPGFGPAWLPFDEIEADRPITIRLVDDLTIRGQVVDLEGTPVRGTTVTLAGAFGMKGDDLTSFFTKLDGIPIVFKQPASVLRRHGLRAIDAILIGLPEKLTTDQDGWLEIKGLGKERLLHLAFTGGDVAFRVVTVASRDMQTIQPQQIQRSISEPIFGSQFKIAISPSRAVEGVVIDADTGQPLPAISIEIQDNSDHHLMKTVSDDQGRFKAMGLPKATRNRLMFSPADDRPYFPLTVVVPDPPGVEPIEMNVKLHRGIWIKGRVTDKVTHAPVVGVHLHYYPLLSNEYAAGVPTIFRTGGNMDNDRNRYQTDASGFYRLVGLAGPAVVGAENEFMRYRPGVGFDQFKTPNDQGSKRLPTWSSPDIERTFVVQRIDPGADEKVVQLDLELDPGLSTTIRVVDPQGELVKGSVIYGTGVRRPSNGAVNFEDGIANVDNLGPSEKRILHAHHADRNLGLMFQLQPPYETGQEKEFVLEPLAFVTGRLLEAGEPMSGLVIIPTYRTDRSVVEMGLQPAVITDADGRFRIGLIPGHEYELQARGRSVRQMDRRSIELADKLNVRAGEKINLGDLELVKDVFRLVKPNAAPAKVDGQEEGENPAPKNPPQPPVDPAPNRNADQAKKIGVENLKGAVTVDAKSADEIVVTGVVLKPDGTPAAGANIRSGAPRSITLETRLRRPFKSKIREAITDENGKFSISMREIPYDDVQELEEPIKSMMNPTVVAASLAGFGPAWLQYDEIQPGVSVTLRLVEDLKIRGQVVSLEGAPVSGTTVTPTGAFGVKSDDLTNLPTGVQLPIVFNQQTRALRRQGLRAIDPHLIGLPEKFITDQNGWFEINGLGKDRLLHLAFTGDDVEHRFATVASREMEATANKVPPRAANELFFGAQFKFVMGPSRPVTGVIVDADSGQPLPGVSVERQSSERQASVRTLMTTVSDDQGRFNVLGVALEGGNRLTFVATGDHPYFPRSVNVPDSPRGQPVEMTVKLHRGIWIKGHVTNKVTHAPVVGVHLHYYPFLTNENAKRVPTFMKGGNMENDDDRYQTDASGSYRLVGLPGPALVGAENELMHYRPGVGFDQLKPSADNDPRSWSTWESRTGPNIQRTFLVRKIEPGPDEKEVRIDLELDPGIETTIRVVDQQGELVKGARFIGIGVRQPPNGSQTWDDGIATIGSLGVDERRILDVYHAERKLGLMIQLQPPYETGRDKEFVLEPLATVTGRLLEGGKPMSGMQIIPTYPNGRARVQMILLPSFPTDSEGRFKTVLIPGHEYRLTIFRKNIPVADNLNVRAGETVDLDDLELDKDTFRPLKANATPAKKEGNEKREKNAPQPTVEPAQNPNADQTKKINVEQPKIAAANDAKSTEEIVVTGVVLKPDGTPAVGATVRSTAPLASILRSALPIGVLPKMHETIAEQDGKFSIPVSRKPYGELRNVDERLTHYWEDTQIVASLSGFGPSWLHYKDIAHGRKVILHLVDDLPVRGQIIDLEGNPVAGTIVKLNGLRASNDENLSTWLDSVKAKELKLSANSKYLPSHAEFRLLGLPETVTTDANGWLEIRGLGKERLIQLSFGDEKVAYQSVTVVNRDIKPLKQVIATQPVGSTEPIFGSKFKFAAGPSRPIQGIIVDASTGAPLPGASVENYKFGDSASPSIRLLKTVTDSAGRFRFVGMPKALGNELVVFPNDDQPYLARHIAVPDPAGVEAIELRIELHRGIWIEGRVTDKVTHDPVIGVEMYYLPYLTNEFASRLPEFARDAKMGLSRQRYRTDNEGKYRLVGLPGSAIVGAKSYLKSYRNGSGYDLLTGSKNERTNQVRTFTNPEPPRPEWPTAMREINPAAGEDSVHLDLELDPGVSADVRIVDQDGKPVQGAEITGLAAALNFSPRSDRAVQTIFNLGPDETRFLILEHKIRNIGLILRIQPPHENGREVTAELLPLTIVTARLLNRGRPISDAVITPIIKLSGNFVHRFPNVTSDSEGRFRCSIPSGSDYQITARVPEIINNVGLVAMDLKVTAGETIDLGDLSLGDDRNFYPLKADENAGGKKKSPAQ